MHAASRTLMALSCSGWPKRPFDRLIHRVVSPLAGRSLCIRPYTSVCPWYSLLWHSRWSSFGQSRLPPPTGVACIRRRLSSDSLAARWFSTLGCSSPARIASRPPIQSHTLAYSGWGVSGPCVSGGKVVLRPKPATRTSRARRCELRSPGHVPPRTRCRSRGHLTIRRSQQRSCVPLQ